MSLITRQGKGSKLTIQEMDGNLNYLDSVASTQEYKQALLPSKSYNPQTVARLDLVGRGYDLGDVIINGYPYVELENGNLATLAYCQSVLKSGILIYEAYDVETEDEIDGYWVAFKQNDDNPKLLEKVAELQMTQQFWDNWYDWTVKDSGDNVVKFVTTNYIFAEETLVESFITTLTYSNGTLTAVDSGFDFGGVDALTLYNDLSGYDIEVASWSFLRAEWILDDDYYGMAIGSQAGWCYYRDTIGHGGTGTEWTCVGFNIITGETRWVDTINEITSNVTNFNFSGVDMPKAITNFFNHPNGISFQFQNAQFLDNGDNVNGVSCVWSPYYDNPNQVIYITNRDYNNGQFLNTGGIIINWYWDNENIYVWQTYSAGGSQSIIVERYNTNTKVKTIWNIPNISNSDLSSGNMSSWSNNNGFMFYINDLIGFTYGKYDYFYFTNAPQYLKLQSNNLYPTNMLGNKTYSTYSSLFRNIYNVGFQIDEYKNIEF